MGTKHALSLVLGGLSHGGDGLNWDDGTLSKMMSVYVYLLQFI
jgi:hypothetical protein